MVNSFTYIHRKEKSPMKTIVWKHGDAWAIRTPDWTKRMYGFESRDMAKEYAKENW